jgi:purine-nucleoside phosphorylase
MSDFIPHAYIEEAATAVRNLTRYQPTIGLVLGSGLSGLADEIEDPDVIPYDQIPHWPVSTVKGHSGRLVIGKLEGKVVLVQQGRSHFYEGYSPAQITVPVRVMHALGIGTIIVTNAAGGINRAFSPGDLMLIGDHINFLGIAGNNPLRGPNDDAIGPRFPDITHAYTPALRELAKQTAVSLGMDLHEGVYAYVAGPSFETAAELRFLHMIGADAVGMSTVPTVIVAAHSGMRVLGIASITNKAILDPVPEAEVSHEEVLQIGKIIVPRLTRLLHGILPHL